jgi:hypothetical protein
MARHRGSFTGGFLSGAVYLTSSLSFPALAAAVSPPDFAPNPSVGWFAYSREFIPPASGAGPVRQDPAHPHVSNDEFRVTGRQPTFPMGDPNSPILQPWASDAIRKRNELIIAGNPVFLPRASCWPLGVTDFLLVPMTMALYFVQGPKEVVMIQAGFNDVRHIHLTEKHSTNVKTSWYGESIGRYEGDTLVVDTIGLDDRTSVDEFGTPHTKQLHVIERFHLIDGGETLEVNVHVEDAGAFTMPWDAIQRFGRFEPVVAKVPIERLPALATPAQGPLIEAICSDNPNSFLWASLPCPYRRRSSAISEQDQIERPLHACQLSRVSFLHQTAHT